MGIEVLDGVGKSHSKIWEAEDTTSPVTGAVRPGRDPATTLACSTSDEGLRRGRETDSPEPLARRRRPTCPGVGYIVLHLQEDKECGHGKRHVALASQAQVVVPYGTW